MLFCNFNWNTVQSRLLKKTCLEKTTPLPRLLWNDRHFFKGTRILKGAVNFDFCTNWETTCACGRLEAPTAKSKRFDDWKCCRKSLRKKILNQLNPKFYKQTLTPDYYYRHFFQGNSNVEGGSKFSTFLQIGRENALVAGLRPRVPKANALMIWKCCKKTLCKKSTINPDFTNWQTHTPPGNHW